jgi:hypothetical protein
VDDELPSVADVAHIDAQPVSTIGGLLHVVRGEYELRGTKYFSHLNGGCEAHWFYIKQVQETFSQQEVFNIGHPHGAEFTHYIVVK